MARKKRLKKEEALALENVFFFPDKEKREKLLGVLEAAPEILLELGAGYGEYTLYLAERKHDTLCLAVDLKLDRLWRGAKLALEKNLENALFLGWSIEKLKELPLEEKVIKIWLPFPDPYPKRRHEKRRLTNPFYLRLYKQWLKKEGVVFLKTDDKDFWEYSKSSVLKTGGRILQDSEDVFRDFGDPEILLNTRYQEEAVKEGKKIYFLSFML